jgi:hypothetical protein
MPRLFPVKKLACPVITACSILFQAACGPGTGGTGTGPTPTLNTPPTNGSFSLGATPIGNDTAKGTWTTLDAKTSVLIAIDKITIISNCIQFTFSGAWVVEANQSIVGQDDINSLLVTFTDQQLNFAIRNASGEVIASGAGLNKTSSEAVAPAIQCSNL